MWEYWVGIIMVVDIFMFWVFRLDFVRRLLSSFFDVIN